MTCDGTVSPGGCRKDNGGEEPRGKEAAQAGASTGWSDAGGR